MIKTSYNFLSKESIFNHFRNLQCKKDISGYSVAFCSKRFSHIFKVSIYINFEDTIKHNLNLQNWNVKTSFHQALHWLTLSTPHNYSGFFQPLFKVTCINVKRGKTCRFTNSTSSMFTQSYSFVTCEGIVAGCYILQLVVTQYKAFISIVLFMIFLIYNVIGSPIWSRKHGKYKLES